MTYKDRLSPWCIIRHLPKSQRLVVGRLRRRNDAEEHLRLLRRMMPTADYSIIFDSMMDSAEATVKGKQVSL
ncbi:MAG: hypothetical protein LDL41_18545 [Coleofasciculus sp. S288]|nr:hypothetical protein [Coleofasciculus sp. S288]